MRGTGTLGLASLRVLAAAGGVCSRLLVGGSTGALSPKLIYLSWALFRLGNTSMLYCPDNLLGELR